MQLLLCSIWPPDLNQLAWMPSQSSRLFTRHWSRHLLSMVSGTTICTFRSHKCRHVTNWDICIRSTPFRSSFFYLYATDDHNRYKHDKTIFIHLEFFSPVVGYHGSFCILILTRQHLNYCNTLKHCFCLAWATVLVDELCDSCARLQQAGWSKTAHIVTLVWFIVGWSFSHFATRRYLFILVPSRPIVE